MKLRQNTPDRLVIEQSPLPTGGFLAGLCLVFLAGLGISFLRDDWGGVLVAVICLVTTVPILFWASEWTRLTLDRGAGTVILQRVMLTRRRSISEPLCDLADIGIEEHEDSRRLTLAFAGRQHPVPVTGHFIGGPAPVACARAAREWLLQSR